MLATEKPRERLASTFKRTTKQIRIRKFYLARMRAAALGPPVNTRLSDVRFNKLRLLHENPSHGERSPPRNNNFFAWVDRTLKHSRRAQAPTLAVSTEQQSCSTTAVTREMLM